MICDNENLIREVLEMLPLSDWLKLEQLKDGYLETYTFNEFERHAKQVAIEEFHQRRLMMQAYHKSFEVPVDLEDMARNQIDDEITNHIDNIKLLFDIYDGKEKQYNIEKWDDIELYVRKTKRTITRGNWKIMKQMNLQFDLNYEIENKMT